MISLLTIIVIKRIEGDKKKAMNNTPVSKKRKVTREERERKERWHGDKKTSSKIIVRLVSVNYR